MVIWLIGLSGSGKTYIAKKIYNKLKNKNNIFWIDGDDFRKNISYDLKYTLKDRKKNSKRIQDFSKYLEEQTIVVIVSILSIFHEHQNENRKIYKKYVQIFVDGDEEKIIKRNNKEIYSRKKNVVGKDIKFIKPIKSDITIKNDFTRKIDLEIIKTIRYLNEKIKTNN